MPEAIAILLIVFLSVAIGLYARHTANAATVRDPEARLMELEEVRRGIFEKLTRARREAWGSDLVHALEEKLKAADTALVQLSARQPNHPASGNPL